MSGQATTPITHYDTESLRSISAPEVAPHWCVIGPSIRVDRRIWVWSDHHMRPETRTQWSASERDTLGLWREHASDEHVRVVIGRRAPANVYLRPEGIELQEAPDCARFIDSIPEMAERIEALRRCRTAHILRDPGIDLALRKIGPGKHDKSRDLVAACRHERLAAALRVARDDNRIPFGRAVGLQIVVPALLWLLLGQIAQRLGQPVLDGIGAADVNHRRDILSGELLGPHLAIAAWIAAPAAKLPLDPLIIRIGQTYRMMARKGGLLQQCAIVLVGHCAAASIEEEEPAALPGTRVMADEMRGAPFIYRRVGHRWCQRDAEIVLRRVR